MTDSTPADLAALSDAELLDLWNSTDGEGDHCDLIAAEMERRNLD